MIFSNALDNLCATEMVVCLVSPSNAHQFISLQLCGCRFIVWPVRNAQRQLLDKVCEGKSSHVEIDTEKSSETTIRNQMVTRVHVVAVARLPQRAFSHFHMRRDMI